MKHEIQLKEFQRSDNAEYSAWFSNPNMDKYMGPAWTDDELTEIFSDKSSSILSAFFAAKLMGVVSVGIPNKANHPYALTGIAVNPKIQCNGMATQIIGSVLTYYSTMPGQDWLAFVSPSNSVAESLLLKLGWQKGALKNDFYQYTFKQRCA